MNITLEAGDGSCTLTQVTNSSSTCFTLPITKDALIASLNDLLNDPEARETSDGTVHIDRMRDGLRARNGNGSFTIPYTHIFSLIVEA